MTEICKETVIDGKDILGSLEDLHYANAIRIANSRTAGCIVSLRECSAGIVQRRLPNTCCLGRALEKTRYLPGEREQRDRTKRERERVVTTRINYDRPCVHPFYERGAPDSSKSLLTDLPPRYPRIISLLVVLFSDIAILKE